MLVSKISWSACRFRMHIFIWRSKQIDNLRYNRLIVYLDQIDESSHLLAGTIYMGLCYQGFYVQLT
jgi:hypothetical protein